MNRLPAVLLVLVLLAASLPTGALAQGTEPWSLDRSTERVELEFRTEDLTADEVEFTVKDRTGLVLLVGETPAAVLEALGLRTGYSQVVTWTSGEGPVIACPALGANLWCESEAGAGLALVPNPGRALLLATAPETPGHAELTVMVSERSLAFDMGVVAVGLALSVVAGETAKRFAMKVASEVVFDLVIRALPEALAAAHAFRAGDYDAAVAALGALVLVVAQLITENAAYWTAVLGIAVITKLVPFLHGVELMVSAAQAAVALLPLVAAMGNEERTTVRVAWDGAGEGEGVEAPDPDTSELDLSCEPDPDFMTAAQVIDALPEDYQELAYDAGTKGIGSVSQLWPSAQHTVEFVVRMRDHLDIWRVSGACAEDFLDAFPRAMSESGDLPWVPRWKSIKVEGEPLWVARPPKTLDFAPAVQVWVRGDVGVLAYDLDAAQLGQLLAGLRSAGSEPEAPSSLSVGAGPVAGRLTDEQPAVDHLLSAEVGEQFGLSMRSADFDAYLKVTEPDGSVLVENDDALWAGGNRTDSYVEFSVPTTGEYTIVASSYQFMTNAEPYGVGEYELELSAVTGVVQAAEDPQGEYVDGAGAFVRIVHQDHEFYYADPTCVMDIDG